MIDTQLGSVVRAYESDANAERIEGEIEALHRGARERVVTVLAAVESHYQASVQIAQTSADLRCVGVELAKVREARAETVNRFESAQEEHHELAKRLSLVGGSERAVDLEEPVLNIRRTLAALSQQGKEHDNKTIGLQRRQSYLEQKMAALRGIQPVSTYELLSLRNWMKDGNT